MCMLTCQSSMHIYCSGKSACTRDSLMCLMCHWSSEYGVQVSYMILQRVTPVTHSVGNCLKRVIVIVASVIVFQNPMSKQNMIGEQSY